MNEIIRLIEQWKATDTTMSINQIKDTETFIYGRYFTKKVKGHKSNKIEIPIKRGAGCVLESVSYGGEHLVSERNDEYLVNLDLPRFPLVGQILAHTINDIKSYETAEQKTEVGKLIGEIQADHKRSFLTTLEYMAAGALFGKIMDGKGKILFEFKSTKNPINLKGKDTISFLRDIDTQLVDELGKYQSYEFLAGNNFLSKLWEQCVLEKLDEKKTAFWTVKDDRRCLEVHGIVFFPYIATYKNTDDEVKKFIEDDEAVCIPIGVDAFITHYGRADHIKAVSMSPQQFFSAIDNHTRGQGYDILSETKSIPICERPTAIIKAIYQA